MSCGTGVILRDTVRHVNSLAFAAGAALMLGRVRGTIWLRIPYAGWMVIADERNSAELVLLFYLFR